jgi:hypothetical protein
MIKERFPVKSAVLQFYELFNWAGTVQGLRFRVKQKIKIQKPHFLKLEVGFLFNIIKI